MVMIIITLKDFIKFILLRFILALLKTYVVNTLRVRHSL